MYFYVKLSLNVIFLYKYSLGAIFVAESNK